MDVRESSVFDDPYDGQYNNGPYNSFESWNNRNYAV
jgi:hypothetical protein